MRRLQHLPLVVLALLLLALLAAGGCGDGGERAASDPWRARTAASLAELIVDQDPFPVFLEPTEPPRLRPVVDAVIALRALRRPVPPGALAHVKGFRAADGTFRDESAADDPLALTWLALRALASPRDAESAWASIAPELSRDDDQVQQLLALRIAELAGVPAARVPGPRAPCRAAGRWENGVSDAAVAVEIARRRGAGCAIPAPVRARVRAAAARSGRIVVEAPAPTGLDVEVARQLVVLRDAGIVDEALVSPAVEAVIGGVARSGPRAADMDTIRPAMDLAAAAGSGQEFAVALLPRVERTVKWQGRLPDVVGTRDPTDTVLGLHALAQLDRRLARRVVAAVAPVRQGDGQSATARVLLQLAFAHPQPAAVDALAGEARAGGLPAALLAQAARRTPSLCSPATKATLARLRPDPVERAPLVELFAAALAADALPACGTTPAAAEALRAVAVRRLAKLRRGALGFADEGAQPDLISTWLGYEASCLLGRGGPAPDAVRATLDRAKAGRPNGLAGAPGAAPTILETHAVVRLDELAERGCRPGWWVGVLTGS